MVDRRPTPRRSLRIVEKKGYQAIRLRSQHLRAQANDPTLKVMSVENINDRIAKDVESTLSGNTNVRIVSLHAVGLSVRGATAIATAIHSSRVREVRICLTDRKTMRSDRVLQILYRDGIAKSATARSISVQSRIGRVEDLMESSASLTEIGISMPSTYDNLSDNDLFRMCHMLKEKAPCLTRLTFAAITFQGSRIRWLSRAVAGNNTLRLLSISGCYLEDQEAMRLVKGWNDSNCRLTTIEAHNNELTADGIISLLNVGIQCRSLSRLDVGCNYRMNELGLERVAGELQGCGGGYHPHYGWNSVDLSNCNPGAEFQTQVLPEGRLADQFLEAVKTNPSLFELLVHGNGVTSYAEEGRYREEVAAACNQNICAAYTLAGGRRQPISDTVARWIWSHLLERFCRRRNQRDLCFWHLRQQPGLFG